MKRRPLKMAATFTLLITSALVTPRNYAQDQTMPEVKVTGEAPDDRHPQDATYAEDRLPGCVEIVTPNTGGELSGSFQAKGRRAGIPVMPSLNDPTGSGRDAGPPVPEQQAFPPGWTSSVPPCL